MRRFPRTTIVTFVIILFVHPRWAAATGDINILVELPESDRMAPVMGLMESLEEVKISRTIPGARMPEPETEVFCTSSHHEFRTLELEKLQEYVRNGAGLVYLFSVDAGHRERANRFLKLFGQDLMDRNTKRQVLHFTRHPVVEGISDLPVFDHDIFLRGRKQIVIKSGRWPIAGVTTIGKGRAVMLPLELILTAEFEGLTPGQRRLIANTCYWAADRMSDFPKQRFQKPKPEEADAIRQGRENPDRPGAIEDNRRRIMRSILDRPRHAPRAEFTGAVVMDILAGDDDWRLIADALDELVSGAAGTAQYVDVTKVRSPLVQVLQSTPKLIVIGSTRRFTVDEGLAIAEYLRLGGSVLFVGHATEPYTMRLVDMTELLREYSSALTLMRPAGTTVLTDHRIAERLPPIAMPKMVGGVEVWSLRAEPVAKARTHPFVSAMEYGDGRVVIMDGKVLLVGTAVVRGSAQKSDRIPFEALVESSIRWLTEN